MACDIYKTWRNTWIKQAQPPAWASEPHAWQQIHINSPEDELRAALPRPAQVAEECARHGVKAIQLVGWNDGGQDQGNPSHDPDPRLGTLDELKEAIAECQALGVKIILFCQVHLERPRHRSVPQGSGTPGDQRPLRRLLPASRLRVPDRHPAAGHQHQAPDPDVLPEPGLSRPGGPTNSAKRWNWARTGSCSTNACTTARPCCASIPSMATATARRCMPTTVN